MSKMQFNLCSALKAEIEMNGIVRPAGKCRRKEHGHAWSSRRSKPPRDSRRKMDGSRLSVRGECDRAYAGILRLSVEDEE